MRFLQSIDSRHIVGEARKGKSGMTRSLPPIRVGPKTLVRKKELIGSVVVIVVDSAKIFTMLLLSLVTRHRDLGILSIVMLRLVTVSFIVQSSISIFAIAAGLTIIYVIVDIVVVIGITPLARLLMLLSFLVCLQTCIRAHLLYFDIVVRCNADYCDEQTECIDRRKMFV